MKLCFDGDKKKQSGFVFVIRDVFALMHGGVVIAGQVVEGRLCQGDQAVCVPGAGKPFLCLIEAIEQPDPGHPGKYVHPGDARADGPCKGNYALKIPWRDKSDFCAGDRLVPVGTVLLEEDKKK